MIAVGIDIATKTGFTLFKCRGETYTLEVLETITAPKSMKDSHVIEKAEAVAETIIEKIKYYASKDPDPKIALEGYGFARHANIAPLFTYGTMIRYFLLKSEYKFLEIPPTSLKKFVTGKGNSKKDMMLKEVYKRWDIDCADDNQADAVGLAMFRMYMSNVIVMPNLNAEAVDNLLTNKDL